MTPTLPLAVLIPDSYWVIPGRLLVGEYPGHKEEAEALVKLRHFCETVVTLFFDLTEAGEHGLRTLTLRLSLKG